MYHARTSPPVLVQHITTFDVSSFTNSIDIIGANLKKNGSRDAESLTTPSSRSCCPSCNRRLQPFHWNRSPSRFQWHTVVHRPPTLIKCLEVSYVRYQRHRSALVDNDDVNMSAAEVPSFCCVGCHKGGRWHICMVIMLINYSQYSMQPRG